MVLLVFIVHLVDMISKAVRKARDKVHKLGEVQDLGSRALSFAVIFTVSVIVFAPFDSLNSSMLLTAIAMILLAALCFVNADWRRITSVTLSVILAFFVVRYFQKGAFTVTAYKVVMGLAILAELGIIRRKSLKSSKSSKASKSTKSSQQPGDSANGPTQLSDEHSEPADSENSAQAKKSFELIPTREYDLERLERYFFVDPVIGVNGAWGTGKTVLVNEFVKRIKKSEDSEITNGNTDGNTDNNTYIDTDESVAEFAHAEKYNHSRHDDDLRRNEWKDAEVIRLGLFELNSGDSIDSVVNVFFNAFDNKLRKNNYLSRHSEAMSVLMGNHHFLEDIRIAISPDHESIDEAVEQMRRALSSLPSRVIMIIEDIDRLSSPEKIRAIFSICEKFAGDRIKVIIEFSLGMLQQIDKSFTYAFVEKFVPDMVNLTPITFQEAADFFLEKDYTVDEFSEQMSEAVKSLNQKVYSSRQQFEALFQQFGIRINDLDDKYADSIRSVVNFLKELRLWLEYENDREHGEQYGSNKHIHELRVRAITSIIFMKHMDHEAFERIELFQSPLDTFGFAAVVEDDNAGDKGGINGEPVFYNVKKIKELSASLDGKGGISGTGGKSDKSGKADEREPEAQKDQVILKYSRAFSDAMNSDPVVINMFRDLYVLGYYVPDVKPTPEQQRRIDHDNEEIDSVIRNYLANGTSEYTRDENFVNELNKAFDEAGGSPEQLTDVFNKVWDRYYSGKTYKHSGTIFRIADNNFARIAQAYLLAEHRSEYWIKLIDFFDVYQNSEVTPGKFEQLYYCGKFRPHYGEPDVFIKCIRLFLNWAEPQKKTDDYSALDESDGSVNFNNDIWYMRFLTEYVDNLYSYGFSSYEGIEYGSLEGVRKVNESPEMVRITLDHCKEVLEERRDRYKSAGLSGLTGDYDLLLSFIAANEQIIGSENSYEAPPRSRTEVHEYYDHKDKDTFNRLKESGTAEEIDKAFTNGQINAAEAEMILKAQEEKNKDGEPDTSS